MPAKSRRRQCTCQSERHGRNHRWELAPEGCVAAPLSAWPTVRDSAEQSTWQGKDVFLVGNPGGCIWALARICGAFAGWNACSKRHLTLASWCATLPQWSAGPGTFYNHDLVEVPSLRLGRRLPSERAAADNELAHLHCRALLGKVSSSPVPCVRTCRPNGSLRDMLPLQPAGTRSWGMTVPLFP